MTQPTAEKSKIKALEGLRGLMAWWVVLGHISLTVGWNLPLIDRNTLAVDVFILLSGFVIALLIERKAEPYLPYITRRAFRIFPLYLVVLVISTLLLPLVLQAWAGVPFTTASNANRMELAQAADQQLLAHVAVHIPLLQGLMPARFLPAAPWTLVGQAWSVSLEWQFYLVAPLMVWGLRTPRRALVAIVAMLAATVSARWFSPAFLGQYIWHFGIGIATYSIIFKPPARRFAGALALGFATVVVYRGGAWQLIPLVIWTAVVGSVMAPRSRLKVLAEALSRPAVVRLGELSYSVYFIHMIPLVIGVYFLNRLQLGQAAYSAILVAFVVLTTYGLALLAFRWIEKPGIRAGANLTAPHGASGGRIA